jgi:hypothetical protein
VIFLAIIGFFDALIGAGVHALIAGVTFFNVYDNGHDESPYKKDLELQIF